MSDPNWSRVLKTETAAKEHGCLCEWWGRGSIIRFDPDCPVLDRHVGRTPESTYRVARVAESETNAPPPNQDNPGQTTTNDDK